MTFDEYLDHQKKKLKEIQRCMDIAKNLVPGKVYALTHTMWDTAQLINNKYVHKLGTTIFRCDNFNKESIKGKILASESRVFRTMETHFDITNIKSFKIFDPADAPLVINYNFVSSEFKDMYLGRIQ